MKCRELNDYNLQQYSNQKTLSNSPTLSSNLAQLTLEYIASYNKESTELVHRTITVNKKCGRHAIQAKPQSMQHLFTTSVHHTPTPFSWFCSLMGCSLSNYDLLNNLDVDSPLAAHLQLSSRAIITLQYMASPFLQLSAFSACGDTNTATHILVAVLL